MDEHFKALAEGQEAAGLSIHRGFPNPSDDHLEQNSRLALDLNQLLIRHPSGTYLFRISGHRWSDQGIYDGDIAVIDRSLRPQNGDLVVTWEDQDFKMQRELSPFFSDSPWGVVKAVIHQYR